MTDSANQLRYIAIEGPIGVGKTTLSHRLAESFAAEVFLERPQDNPFLEKFYNDPKGYALAAQLSFLVQRARQVDQLRQGDLFASRCVADVLFAKDRLFAQLNLKGAEFDLYDEIFRRLAWQAPRPDCVIYLHAPVDVLMQRVRKRNRHEEANLTEAYLHQVSQTYAAYFSHYRETQLIVVDADSHDLVGSRDDYNALLEALATPQSLITL